MAEPSGTAKLCPCQGTGRLCEALQGLAAVPPLAMGNTSGFSILRLPTKRVRAIKEICEPVFGGMGPAWRWLPRHGSLGDGTTISQESEGSNTALSQAAPRGNWSEPYEMR